MWVSKFFKIYLKKNIPAMTTISTVNNIKYFLIGTFSESLAMRDFDFFFDNVGRGER